MEDQRRRALKVCALATGLADKAVSLVYERVLHQTTSEQWIARCRTQIADVLSAPSSAALVKAAHEVLVWRIEIGHADIAVGCALPLYP